MKVFATLKVTLNVACEKVINMCNGNYPMNNSSWMNIF